MVWILAEGGCGSDRKVSGRIEFTGAERVAVTGIRMGGDRRE